MPATDDPGSFDPTLVNTLLAALPAAARKDSDFLETARRVVADCSPHNALQEQAVIRILHGLWRMKPLLAADNDELDERALAEAEKSLARAEMSWCRLRRLELAEQRANEHGRPRPGLARHDAMPRPASTFVREPEELVVTTAPQSPHDSPTRASPSSKPQTAVAQQSAKVEPCGAVRPGAISPMPSSPTPRCPQERPETNHNEPSATRREVPRAPAQGKHSARLRRRHAARRSFALAGS
jgi:hypothetical protein